MIAPLQQSPIRGVIWYQGEANANRANPYVDQMRELITAWRDGWANPAPLKNFTFILHQLSACTYGGDVPALRWSQQGAVAPWSTLPNVIPRTPSTLHAACCPLPALLSVSLVPWSALPNVRRTRLKG